MASPATNSGTESDQVTGLVVKYASDVVGPLSTDAPVPGAVSADVQVAPGPAMGLGWYEVTFPEPVERTTAQSAAQRLMSQPAIEYAEPQIWMRPANSTPEPNDPLWFYQWGFASYGDSDFVLPDNDPADVLGPETVGTNLLEALQTPRGDTPRVAVIDSGVTNHPDLSGRLTSGYNFISDPARAENEVGRSPNFYDPGDGVTAEQAASLPFSRLGCLAPTASKWHGTHVTGTIAALTDNVLGIAGTLPVEIQTLRALGRCGGSSGDIAAAMLWASGGSVPGAPPNPTPARVVNMSLVGGGVCPQHYQDVIDFGIARGTVFVAAAGNANTDAALFTPANCAGVITVAATDPYGGRASFSNYGQVVDIAAPGLGIMSTSNAGAHGPLEPSYIAQDGTSMAAPHVSGAVAMLLAAEPELTVQQVKDRLTSTSTAFKQSVSEVDPDNPAYDCVGDDSCGSGYLNTAALLGQPTADAPVVAPRFQVRPTTGAATAERSIATGESDPAQGVDIRITFEPSPSDPDQYFYQVAGKDSLLTDGETTLTDVTVTVPGTVDDDYAIVLTPITDDSAGVAARAMRVPGVDGTVPPPPAIEQVSTTDTQAVVNVTNTFSVPVTTETTVTAQPGDLSCVITVKPTDSGCVLNGLTPGVEYTFTATSSNALGVSAVSDPVRATPQPDSPPSAPTISSVVVQGNTATVTWTPSIPATGRTISGYAVRTAGASPIQLATCNVTGSAALLVDFCQVPNLYYGEDYQFIVAALDDRGAIVQSEPSAPVSVLGTAVAPSSPQLPPDVSMGDGKATLRPVATQLDIPQFNGGSPIIGLRFIASPGGGSCYVPWDLQLSQSSCEITGLTNGQEYTFTALAYNVMGGSVPSDPTVPLTAGRSAPAGELAVLAEPVRVLDTRLSGQPMTPGVPVTTGVQAPAGAIAADYNLTITGTSGSGYATVFPAGETIPMTSVSNWGGAGTTIANGYVTGLGVGGEVSIAVAGTPAHAVLDIVGYYLDTQSVQAIDIPPDAATETSHLSPGAVDVTATTDSADGQISGASNRQTSLIPGGRFTPIPPARAYDSRTADGPLRGGSSRTVDLSRVVPEGTTAVSYNLTETGTAVTGFLAVGLPGGPIPDTSVINWTGPNQTMANASIAAISADRSFEVFAAGRGSTQFVVDITGYYAPAQVAIDGLMFTPISPQRAYDSRIDTPGGALSGGQRRTTSLAATDVPVSAEAIAANLTATGTTESGWLALLPSGESEVPQVSTLNWMRPETTIANGTTTGSVNHSVTTYAAGGSTEYVLDIAGYFHRPRN